MNIKRIGLKAFCKAAIITSSVMLAACSANVNDTERMHLPDQSSFSAERIKADMAFLADDTLKGRETGSESYRIAANYVAAEYMRLGLKPAGDNGTYFQEVPFKTAKIDAANSSLSAIIDGKETTFKLGDDFYMGGSVQKPTGDVSGQVVFVGYGISDKSLGYDDLGSVDLTGKIALVLSGAPQNFNTEIRAYYGSQATKAQILAEQGAIGMITVNTLVDEKRRPFARYKRFLGHGSFDWIMPEGATADPSVKVGAMINADVASKLFEGSGTSFDTILEEADKGKLDGPIPLKANVHMKRATLLSETVYSPNVVGIIEGSDPKLKNEYVVISAHLDHIGVNEHAKGEDKINNGALDNAAGTAVMMEVARVYAKMGVKPRRSLLFAAVTGEEKGLLGAEYFAHYPTVPLKSMVANVNLDMPVLLYDFTDVVAFGADHSSLGPVTEQALSKIGIALTPDPMPEEGIFTRSDHFRFVQQGIPSVFLVTGFAKDTQGKDGGKIFLEFLHNRYHSPADQLDQPIDYNAGAKFAYVNWLIMDAVANANTRPTWNEGDFFGGVYAK